MKFSVKWLRRAGRGFKMHKSFQFLSINYEPRFNDIYSRDNKPKIKDGAFINLDDKQSKGTYWV